MRKREGEITQKHNKESPFGFKAEIADALKLLSWESDDTRTKSFAEL